MTFIAAYLVLTSDAIMWPVAKIPPNPFILSSLYPRPGASKEKWQNKSNFIRFSICEWLFIFFFFWLYAKVYSTFFLPFWLT